MGRDTWDHNAGALGAGRSRLPQRGAPLTPRHRSFDRRYYDRWYRHPGHRVVTPADTARKVAFAVGIAEHLLQRRIRSVLDVGCGEALWRAPLRRLRPRVRYDGVDTSEYVVQRFGRTRNVRLGTFGELGTLGLRGPYDLVVCADVMHYLSPDECARGLAAIRALVRGVAYLTAATTADDVAGDVRGINWRRPSWYLGRIRAAGLVPIGLECYVPRSAVGTLLALERVASRAR